MLTAGNPNLYVALRDRAAVDRVKVDSAALRALLADAACVRQDFRRVGVLLGRPVPGLLQQRHVDHRSGVALGARIAVPVPGAAEVAALLDDAKVLHASLAQTCAREQTAEATADDHNL